MIFRSTGVLRYSPKLLGDKSSSKWWLVVDCDVSIGKYYRHLYKLHTHRCRKLQSPAWKEHITVIRDEEPSYKEFWGKYAGEIVEFLCESNAEDDGLFAWLPVSCTRLHDIRTELGLPRQSIYPFHLTFGNLK